MTKQQNDDAQDWRDERDAPEDVPEREGSDCPAKEFRQ